MSILKISEWGLLLLILGSLIYTALIIKNEKKFSLQNSFPYSVGPFSLKVPPWWNLSLEADHKKEFNRIDSHYDWKASFEWIPFDGSSLPNFLQDHLREWKIIFDKDFLSQKDQDILFLDPHLPKDLIRVLRVEGTATQEQYKRIYCDIFLIQGLWTPNSVLLCQSMSSVLNGLIEGPYFEDVVKRLKLSLPFQS